MTTRRAERRAHARYPRTFDVAARNDGTLARMEAQDLSLGGLSCASPTDFPEMTRLGVTLMLPSGNGKPGEPTSLDVEAVVVRRRKLDSVTGSPRFELALFFTRMSDTQRETLARFIAAGV